MLHKDRHPNLAKKRNNARSKRRTPSTRRQRSSTRCSSPQKSTGTTPSPHAPGRASGVADGTKLPIHPIRPAATLGATERTAAAHSADTHPIGLSSPTTVDPQRKGEQRLGAVTFGCSQVFEQLPQVLAVTHWGQAEGRPVPLRITGWRRTGAADTWLHDSSGWPPCRRCRPVADASVTRSACRTYRAVTGKSAPSGPTGGGLDSARSAPWCALDPHNWPTAPR
jgi:hypothetical protein